MYAPTYPRKNFTELLFWCLRRRLENTIQFFEEYFQAKQIKFSKAKFFTKRGYIFRIVENCQNVHFFQFLKKWKKFELSFLHRESESFPKTKKLFILFRKQKNFFSFPKAEKKFLGKWVFCVTERIEKCVENSRKKPACERFAAFYFGATYLR